MLPATAARVATLLPDGVVQPLLSSAGIQSAAAVLRHVVPPRRTELVEGLPAGAEAAVRLLLRYSDDTVAAWVEPEVLTFDIDTTVEIALERAQSWHAPVAQIYALRSDRRLAGVVELHKLLRAAGTARLAQLMRPPVASLPAAMPLRIAAAHAAWERSNVLPVVDRSDRLIGLLEHATLSRALALAHHAPGPRAEPSLVGVVAARYWDALSGLAEAGVGLLPSAPPVRTKGQ
jgi:magnesium transporter